MKVPCNLSGLPGVPDVHVIGNDLVIGSRLHEAIVKVGLKMMCLEPHTHIHSNSRKVLNPSNHANFPVGFS